MHKRNFFIRFKLVFPLAALLAAILACSHDHTPVDPESVKDQDLSNRSWYLTSFCDLDLSGKNFSQADLGESLFQKVNLKQAIFRGADLSHANFQFANLRGADFTGARLDHASFFGADLTDALLDEKWAKIMPLLVSGNGERAQLQGYDLQNVDFRSHNNAFCDWNLLEWEDSFIFNLSEANLEKALLDGSSLYRARLENANLRYASLEGTNLHDSNLQNANLEGANLQNAEMFNTRLRSANLSGANLSETNLYHADLRNTDLRQTVFEKTDLQYANLLGALVNLKQLQNAILGCTVLPNGNIYKVEECEGQTPGALDLIY